VAGGFVHGNRLHALGVLKELSETRRARVQYGPRHDESLARYAATVSVFWLYFGIRVAPAAFPGMADASWLALHRDSYSFLRGYLADLKTALLKSCDAVDAMVKERSED
jgi:hypothetical protein